MLFHIAFLACSPTSDYNCGRPFVVPCVFASPTHNTPPKTTVTSVMRVFSTVVAPGMCIVDALCL